MNPSCPFCDKTLKLKTYSWTEITKEEGIPVVNKMTAKFWVCFKDKVHWARNASIMKVTARSGVKPGKKSWSI